LLVILSLLLKQQIRILTVQYGKTGWETIK
jgi:hypothetical protein